MCGYGPGRVIWSLRRNRSRRRSKQRFHTFFLIRNRTFGALLRIVYVSEKRFVIQTKKEGYSTWCREVFVCPHGSRQPVRFWALSHCKLRQCSRRNFRSLS